MTKHILKSESDLGSETMQHLALALVKVAAFLELSGDDVVDPDSAVKALEMISADLQDSSEAEKDALRTVLAIQLQALESQGQAESEDFEFFQEFMKAVGLEPYGDEDAEDEAEAETDETSVKA